MVAIRHSQTLVKDISTNQKCMTSEMNNNFRRRCVPRLKSIQTLCTERIDSIYIRYSSPEQK